MAPARPLVLIAVRDRAAARSLPEFLSRNGFETIGAHDTEEAVNVLDRRRVRCVVSELRGRGLDGLAVLRRAIARDPDACVVLVTADESVEQAVAAMREGAYDVLVRPIHLERLLAILKRGVAHQELAARVTEMRGQLDERLGLEQLTGASHAIHRVMEQVRAVAPTRANVLIEGEPGTGKRFVALSIHRNSPRREERFVWANCAVPGEGVVEADLFGDERAGSDPDSMRRGRLEMADGGTLFLDEVGEAPPGVQVRLLRLLQERSFERIGGAQTLHADVRLVASTSRDLAADARAGRFRADLLQRLAVVHIHMPALRERRDDIPLLVESFLEEFNREHGRRVTGITPGALDRLMRHRWSGNLRELKNTVEGIVAVTTRRGPIDLGDLPPSLRSGTDADASLAVSVGMTVEEAEKHLISATLRHTGGDKPRSAALLGIGLRTLYRKIERYHLG
jgi:DNA-binding NtrC family response regulator